MIRPVVLLISLALTGGALYMATRPDDSSAPTGEPAARSAGPSAGDGAGPGAGTGAASGESGSAGSGSPPRLPRSSCEPGLSNCVVASGTVIYVEAVDPDGDGDAHFVTTSEEGVTLPGMTIFDVGTDLRPDPLPEVGDLVGGAGPVFRGSRGQKQIEVTEFHVAR